MKRILPAGVIPLLFLVSCSQGLLSDLSRVITDPVVKVPKVVSFTNDDSVIVSWDKDPGADEYLLYRALDVSVPVYDRVYRGRELTFEDRDTTEGYRYLYTLTKVRGTKLFGPSDAVLGVVSGVVPDSLEDNNTKDKASHLEWDLQSNLYYYQAYGNEKLVDYDWYSVTVPPRRKAIIVITQDGLAGGAASWMTYSQEGHSSATATNGDGIEIPNYTYGEKTFYFRISPRASEFVSDLTRGGGGFINYTVSLNQITGL